MAELILPSTAHLGAVGPADLSNNSTGFFRSIIEGSADPIGICDLHFRLTYLNEAGKKLLGLNALAAAPLASDLFLPEDRAWVAEKFFPQVAAEGSGAAEIQLRHFSSGGPIWVSCKVHQIRDSSGRQAGFAMMAHEIGDRRQAVEALKRCDAQWSAAIDSFAVGVIIASEVEQVIYWNPAAQAMHGLRPREGIEPLADTPKTFELWLPDESHLLVLDEWPMRRIKRGEVVKNLELRLRRPDQNWERLVSYSGSMVTTAQGDRLIFLSVHDLTEQRNVEANLVRTKSIMEAVLDRAPSASWSWTRTRISSWKTARSAKSWAAPRRNLGGRRATIRCTNSTAARFFPRSGCQRSAHCGEKHRPASN